MSRYSDYYDGEDWPGQWELYQANARRALRGKRGRKALADLRDALNALPQKRLIRDALCTWNAPVRIAKAAGGYGESEIRQLCEEQGPGVCAVGAYVLHQRMKAGLNIYEALDSLPTLDSGNHDLYETQLIGERAGLVGSLAWNLAYRNDETFGDCTPEERWTKFMAWIDEELAVTA